MKNLTPLFLLTVGMGLTVNSYVSDDEMQNVTVGIDMCADAPVEGISYQDQATYFDQLKPSAEANGLELAYEDFTIVNNEPQNAERGTLGHTFMQVTLESQQTGDLLDRGQFLFGNQENWACVISPDTYKDTKAAFGLK